MRIIVQWVMAAEIEWKFLVTQLPELPDCPYCEIEQAYFTTDDPEIRVRCKGNRGFISFKIAADGQTGGARIRSEYEYEIPADEARALIGHSRLVVRKRRYDLPDGIELDVYSGALSGLITAEYEVDSASAPAPAPPDGWRWTDVSQDKRFANRCLAQFGIPA